MQANRRLPSSTVIVLSTLGFLGFLLVTGEGRLCDSHKDCLGDYRQCCIPYCRRLCNLTCSRDEHCGSPGSIEEYCCKGKCISTSSLCEKPPPQEDEVLSTPVIAVIVIFVVMLVVALCLVFRSHLCKFRTICLGQRAAHQAEIGFKHRGANQGFVELGQDSSGTDESSHHPGRISVSKNSSWVGQDIRIAPPKSSRTRNGRM